MASTGAQDPRWIHDDFETEWESSSWERDYSNQFARELQIQLRLNASDNAASFDSTDNPSCSLLLRNWLKACDRNHITCRRRPGPEKFRLKRVVDVGDLNRLALVKKPLSGNDYLALSYSWGSPTPEEKKQFCTTSENYGARKRGFSYGQLPKTFQDAVQVTRALQKQYLWIDALCIIQEGPDCDWESEARTMADIFTHAYCTIAASSARGWKDGFLNPQPGPPDIGVRNTSSTPTCKCDFDQDVDKGALMKRAWVLQERVLSRRIIHFTAAHIYCECGDGVLFLPCSRPRRRQYFILDPAFPSRLAGIGDRRTADFVQFLFKKYSASRLTFETDRDVAVDSLVERMGQVLGTEVRYGIFDRFRCTLLLWKRTQEKTARIPYSGRTVPSWPITQVPRRVDLGFTNDGKALNFKVRRFGGNCQMGLKGGSAIIVDGKEVGCVWLDVADWIELEYCAVVGMYGDDQKENARKIYYVLIIQKKEDGLAYERLGVGMVEAQYVSIDCDAGTLW
ncbi:heterokaryon incompatibility protein-domain-containing protein [Immersiella caudata]|uniref:Heterokaryon incompatibility protein-domain-containing protein n=1 Tax=Immersiella caudata TaxID=314043 RepID=A0AA39WR42_9PEZI|nr:heterokaryon incompatibility protein-domain-containing protein [Immersiella caudata]